MKKGFLPLSMVLITMLLAQAGLVSNAAETQGKYTPRTNTKATVSSYMKSIRANQETGLIDPALQLKAQKAAKTTSRGNDEWKVMGPDNYGALTRAMIYDQNDPTNNTLLIGTMGGHIFKSTNGGITMQQAYSLNTTISCMIQIDGTTFVGTGDGRMAQNANGLGDLGYETSFIGEGIYRISGNEIILLPSTKPTAENGWGFVNEMAALNNGKTGLYAATDGGLYYTETNGNSWELILAGEATAVRSNSVYTLAVVDQDVIRITWENGTPIVTSMTGDGDSLLPATAVEKTIAVSESDANFMYVCYLTTAYKTGDIFFTNDGGVTWQIAMAQTDIYNMHATRGYIDNAINVFPNNPRKLLIGGADVWTLEDATCTGVYRPVKVSEGQTNELLELAGNSFIYVHSGIQNFVFNPDNANVFFVGTEGGVFKGTYAQQTYTFRNCNRYFITEEEHTSVARMFGVGIGGDDDRVLGGCLDHGTILMEGDEDLNNITTGRAIFPNCDPTSNAAVENGHSVFNWNYAGGQCAISTIANNIMFVSATGSMTTPLYRTETSGEDYDMSNFYNADNTLSSVITNANAFRTPFALYENYNDLNSTRETFYTSLDTVNPPHAGDIVYVHSKIGNFPFEYVLPYDIEPRVDTIFGIKDKVTATMVCGIEDNIYMTRNAHYFDELSEWWRIGKISGIPTTVAISGDGDMTIVGTESGNLYRVTNLKEAVAANLANIDSTECVIVMDTLDNSLFEGRAITSVSIDPNNNNNIVLTLGNYGNDDYVFASMDMGETFESVQGDLIPKAPIYSSVIEKSTGIVYLGTEYGIYKSGESEGSWLPVGSINVPVTDLKQALVTNRPSIFIPMYGDKDTTYTEYPGVTNEGVLYAATYGNGIVKCNDYRVGGADYSVDENTIAGDAFQMNVYPNPIRGNANISFDLAEAANVSYQIYDLSGRMISSRVIGTMQQGKNTVPFGTENLASGSYILRVQAGNKVNTSKIMVF